MFVGIVAHLFIIFIQTGPVQVETGVSRNKNTKRSLTHKLQFTHKIGNIRYISTLHNKVYYINYINKVCEIS